MKRRSVALGLLAAVTSVASLSPHRAVVNASSNPVQIENAKQGTTGWKITNSGYATGVIEGYASLTSVNRGGQIKFFVNTIDPSYTISFYRLGYYGGLGGRLLAGPVTRAGIRQAIPAPDLYGNVECNWIDPYVLSIPNTADPTDWLSGIYVAKLTGSSGKQQYIMFVVRDDARASDLLMAQTVNRYQAYNVWGGKSLYGTIANRGDTANKADKVSFDRPYYGDEGHGAALLFNWEHPMMQWLEKEGYDVAYATNVDVDLDPNLLLNRQAFLSVGHDEYWSWRMRDNVERARDSGVSLGFFSGNTAYWQVRYENSAATNALARTLVGYKENWKQDPITPDYLKTNLFRKAPVNRPEEAMIGVSFVTQARPPFVVEDASHWAFTGTGLQNGDVLLNADGSPFLGYEIDAMGPMTPPDARRLAHSPATPREANFGDMTIYRAASGATVFSSGSIAWSSTIPQIQQITRNVLARLISNAFTDSPPVRPSPPSPFVTGDIGAVGRAGFVSLAGAQGFTINGAGTSAVDGNDALFYVCQSLAGDGQIVARLNALQLYWDNRAGVMIRESLSPGAKYVSLVGRPSESIGSLLEGVELKVKSVAGTRPSILAQQDMRLPNWLKLVRRGNTFDAYSSADGTAWTLLGSTTVTMGASVYVGAFVASSRDGVWATARFDNVAVNGGSSPPPDTIAPAVTITAPANGATVSGSVGMTASASDNVGVAGVLFTVDGAALGAERTAAPYTVTWDSRTASNGPHTIAAIARDAAGNTTAASIAVTVANQGAARTRGDFDGDGRADLAAFRPSSGTWLIDGQASRTLGLPGDVPVPGDYDGDGRTDAAVFRPSTGEWFVQNQATAQWGRSSDVPVPADFTGDGVIDRAVFRTSDGAVASWQIQGQPSRAWGLRGDVPIAADFDGDGRADLAVYRPSSGTWYVLNSATGYATSSTTPFGLPGDVPLAADFDGDGRADFAVWRPSTGTWYLAMTVQGSATIQFGLPGDVPAALDLDGDRVLELCVWRSSTGTWYAFNRVTSAIVTRILGAAGDLPAAERPRLARGAPADFDSDGRADVTVYRPSDGTWFVCYSSTGYGTYATMAWGLDGDAGVAADYDGDRRADAAVYRPSNGTWYLRLSSGGSRTVQWGLPGDLPAPADYDGDGRADLAVYRPSSGTWFVRFSSSDYATWSSTQWGLNGDVAAPADYDGDGRADAAVYRPSTGTWYLSLTSSGWTATVTRQWGAAGDVAAPADFDGDGRTDLVVYRPSTGEWFGIDALTGAAVVQRQWGLPGDAPAPLDYDGDGVDDSAIYRAGDGGWYIRRSSDGAFTYLQWGLPADRPVGSK